MECNYLNVCTPNATYGAPTPPDYALTAVAALSTRRQDGGEREQQLH